ncbi:MAG: glycosyl transferase family 6 [Lachnospiraceae bacterium]|nr:glycosyl transferase family 6 [Lachnospiraceae bacterium]
MKTIGILYICTGKYDVFWEDFYISFENYFLPNTEKHYFVFTDATYLYDEGKNPRIHKKMIGFEPWPLPTLLKYRTFLTFESELAEMDYLYQSNANIICNETITEEEFLPREKDLFFNIHPGYMKRKPVDYPYDRNPASLAYVPYNKGKIYVFGAMNGGKSAAFIRMMKEVEARIEMDLKKGVIARWHDESHVNHYVATHTNYSIHSPAYCYPVGFDVDYPSKIAGVSKADKFDVDELKGYQPSGKKTLFIKRLFTKLKNSTILVWLRMRDSILRKQIKE